MKRHSSDRIRNVAVCGHGGTGKTSLVEAMLFAAKAIERLGRVEEGTTTTDFDAEEIRRRITISAALAPLEWQDHKINLIDTPGYPDFIGEVSGALRAVESIALTVDAVAGVEVQTEKIWALAAHASASRLVVVTRMDRENAAFARAVDSLQQKFGRQLVPLQSPIGSEGGFSGVVDLVTMQASGDAGPIPRDKIPADALEAATAMRERLVEAVAETDERLTEVYLEQGQLADDALTQGLHVAVRAGTLVPVLCVAATRGRGVTPLLDALVKLLPAPTERDPIGAHNGKGTAVPVAPDPAGPLAAQVWKTMADPYVGKLSYFRVFSGVLKSDAQVWNAGKGKVERIGQLLQLRGKHQEPAAEFPAGDIGAVAKLADAATGDTLTDKDKSVALEPIEFPKPAIAMAVQPKSKADEDKLGSALARLVEEDHTLATQRANEMHQTILAGMGESHLEIVADRLKRKFGVEVTLSLPRVAYRETVRAHARVQGKHKKQSGGRGQYGDCWIELDPAGRGGGYEFVDKVFGGAIPRQYIPAVEKGVNGRNARGDRRRLPGGRRQGHPRRRVLPRRRQLGDGLQDRRVDGVSRRRCRKRSPCCSSRSGRSRCTYRTTRWATSSAISTRSAGTSRAWNPGGDGTTTVRAQVPMAEMLRYASDLRSLTGGRGTFELEFSHYAEVPSQIADKVTAEARKQKEAVEAH